MANGYGEPARTAGKRYLYLNLPRDCVKHVRRRDGKSFYAIRFPKGFKLELPDGRETDLGGCRFTSSDRYVHESRYILGARTITLTDDPAKPDNVWVSENVLADQEDDPEAVQGTERWVKRDVGHFAAAEIADAGKRWLSTNKATISVPAACCTEVKDRGYTVVQGPKDLGGEDWSHTHWYARVPGRHQMDGNAGVECIKFQAIAGAGIPLYDDAPVEGGGRRKAVKWITPKEINHSSFIERRDDAASRGVDIGHDALQPDAPATPKQVKYVKDLIAKGRMTENVEQDLFDAAGNPTMSVAVANLALNSFGGYPLDLDRVTGPSAKAADADLLAREAEFFAAERDLAKAASSKKSGPKRHYRHPAVVQANRRISQSDSDADLPGAHGAYRTPMRPSSQSEPRHARR